MPVEWGLIEWEEFIEAFLGKYFSRDRWKVKVEEFINLKQRNMSV